MPVRPKVGAHRRITGILWVANADNGGMAENGNMPYSDSTAWGSQSSARPTGGPMCFMRQSASSAAAAAAYNTCEAQTRLPERLHDLRTHRHKRHSRWLLRAQSNLAAWPSALHAPGGLVHPVDLRRSSCLNDLMRNERIALILEHVADLLEQQGENAFRVMSYMRGAQTLRDCEWSVQEMLERNGLSAVKELPGIGERLAGSVREIVETGRLGLLERLESRAAPERLIADLPGVGQRLARRIHEQLGVDSLEALEQAAHDGRLRQVEGVGPNREQGIRDALAGKLSRGTRRRAERKNARHRGHWPGVDVLLDVDAEYRRKAQAGELRRIAPKRFNPESRKWLPLLHTRRNGWKFTALFSNTAKAHDLGKTGDWVVIYYRDDGRENQNTVITAGSGPLQGKRIVRGREPECRDYYGEPSSD